MTDVCPASGMERQQCLRTICDCFYEQFPDDPYALHPELFVIAGDLRGVELGDADLRANVLAAIMVAARPVGAAAPAPGKEAGQ